MSNVSVIGAEGADSLHPLDAELNLPRERYSFELRRTAAVEVSKGAFDEAVASLGRHTGAKVGKRQVEELAGRAAEDFDAFYGQRAPPALFAQFERRKCHLSALPQEGPSPEARPAPFSSLRR